MPWNNFSYTSYRSYFTRITSRATFAYVDIAVMAAGLTADDIETAGFEPCFEPVLSDFVIEPKKYRPIR